MSAIQIARFFGAVDVYAVDIDEAKLQAAQNLGAIPVNNAGHGAAEEIRRLTGGRGVDVALELVGLQATMEQCVESVGYFGRVVVVGISHQAFQIDSYAQLLTKEPIITGSRDHPTREVPKVIDLLRRKILDLSNVVTDLVPLDAAAVNGCMDRLEQFDSGLVRAVILPEG
jgi:propanol-preferring alcohol dehydrogenase